MYQEWSSGNGQLIHIVGAVIPTPAAFLGEEFFKAHEFKARAFLLFSMLLTKVDGSWHSLIQDPIENQMECRLWFEHCFPDRLGVISAGIYAFKIWNAHNSELVCPMRENHLETGELSVTASHLKYSLPYCGWYQAALYKCYPLLHIKDLEINAKNCRMSTFIFILLWLKHMYFQRTKDSLK